MRHTRPVLTRTKTIATVGPACENTDQLKSLLELGVDVFRLNMAHGDRSQHQQLLENIRKASRDADLPVGTLVDLAGPKIRLGQLHTDPIQLDVDSEIWFVKGDVAHDERSFVCSYAPLVDEIEIGNQIVLCDGLVRLSVEEKQDERIRCRVVDGGQVRSRQGVNLPGVNLGVPALLERDRENAIWAAKQQVQFIGLSFVRTAGEIQQLKDLLEQQDSSAMVVAKIEKREALDQLESIVQTSDAIMVARGDLGVEIEIEKTPLAQKRIIRMCQNVGKPVIVATQMLESMIRNRQPTRAEATDVANAILDGADACMLSGETAIGAYPEQSVAVMQKIKHETEQALAGRPSRRVSPDRLVTQGVSEAVVFGAALIAQRVQAKLFVLVTSQSHVALAKSKQRNFIPTIGITDQPDLLNRMCLFWGITPVYLSPINSQQLRSWLEQWSKENEFVTSGDKVVFVMDTAEWPGVHERVVVAEVD